MPPPPPPTGNFENLVKPPELFLSIIIPCFNEEPAVPVIYNEINKTPGLPANREIIFVDDGSTDHTLRAAKEIAEKDGRVHYISFSRNFGKEAALLAGLEACEGAYAVTMDVDGQDPPALIPAMLEAVQSGEYDCAGTRRVTRRGEPPVRSFFVRRFYALMAKIADIEIVDGARDFRLMSRSYVDAALSVTERGRFSKGIFPWLGFATKWFEYENITRSSGVTKWSFWKLFLYSLDGIIAFSTKPLAIASVAGVLFFIIALFFILFIAVRKMIWGDPVNGWASTACIILFCSGIQLFTTGVLGQYLAKTYTEVKNRPHFIIREIR